MEINPQYASRIYSNATVLLRPKTGLNDMVAELDPGSAGAGTRLHSGATLGASQTLPTVSLDEVLSQLDGDTRDELMMLVSNAGQALANGGGTNLGNVFRRFDPLSRDVLKASHLVALRSVELKRLTGNLAKIATELGDTRPQLTAFVKGNAGVFHAFSDQDQQPPADDPAAARGARRDEHRADPGDHTGQHAVLHALLARRERPRSRPDPVRPAPVLQRDHAGAPRPAATLLGQGAADRQGARPGHPAARHGHAASGDARDTSSTTSSTSLRYKPKNGQSYLFYLPWANHDTNSVALHARTASGPLRQQLILFNCGSLQLLHGTSPTRSTTRRCHAAPAA